MSSDSSALYGMPSQTERVERTSVGEAFGSQGAVHPVDAPTMAAQYVYAIGGESGPDQNWHRGVSIHSSGDVQSPLRIVVGQFNSPRPVELRAVAKQ
jgi:hypothetical protein